MEVEYRYFIAYKHSEGYGNMQATFSVKIKNILDIQEIQKYIVDEVKKNEGYVTKDVVIISFQLFD